MIFKNTFLLTKEATSTWGRFFLFCFAAVLLSGTFFSYTLFINSELTPVKERLPHGDYKNKEIFLSNDISAGITRKSPISDSNRENKPQELSKSSLDNNLKQTSSPEKKILIVSSNQNFHQGDSTENYGIYNNSEKTSYSTYSQQSVEDNSAIRKPSIDSVLNPSYSSTGTLPGLSTPKSDSSLELGKLAPNAESHSQPLETPIFNKLDQAAFATADQATQEAIAAAQEDYINFYIHWENSPNPTSSAWNNAIHEFETRMTLQIGSKAMDQLFR